MSRALLVTQVYADAVVSLCLLGHVNKRFNGLECDRPKIKCYFGDFQGFAGLLKDVQYTLI